MKPEPSNTMRRKIALSTIGLTTILASSCALPPREAWNQIKERGLLPVLIDGGRPAVASNTTGKPSEQDAVRVQAVTTPVVVRTSYADAVPGRSGYVFSPHTTPRQVVDVRGFNAGEEVRCPFTSQPFLVPDFKAVAEASKPAPQQPVRRVTEVVSNTATTPEVIHYNSVELEPAPEMKAVTPEPVEPVKSTPAAAPLAASPAPTLAPAPAPTPAVKQGLLYGSRVPGRPGFVYSPHATKTQLVDVAGTAPGVVVKCPYTNKLFRVPEVNAEEIQPESFSPAPPLEKINAPGNTLPAPAPEQTPPAPSTPVNPSPSPDSPR